MIVIGTREFVRSALIAGFVLAAVVVAEMSAGGVAEFTAGGGGGGAAIDVESPGARVHGGHEASQDALAEQHEDAVRRAVWRYTSRAVALDDGYEPCGVCDADRTYYVDEDATTLVKASIAPESPQVLCYEHLTDGRPQLVAVKYAVSVEAWRETGNDGPPAHLGRSFVRDDGFLEEPTYLLVVPVERYLPVGGLLR